MSNQSLAIPVASHALRGDKTAIGQIRHNFLQLQALVTVVLSYQVLFTDQSVLDRPAQLPAVLGLMLTCAVIMIVPNRWIWAGWFPGALALGDTVIVTTMIALTESFSSDLYLAYFVILLIATMSQTPKQMFIFFSIVCGLYGFVLYRDYQASGVLLEHHLMRIPLLVVMAVFYGRTVESLRRLAEFDPLTGLPNRRTFVSLVGETLARARTTHETIALMFVNLDGFKLINDTLGRRVGDQLLIRVSTRLTHGPGKGHVVAREGGDEFAILIDHIGSPQECATMADEVMRTVEAPFSLNNRELFITASIGISLFPQDAEDADALLRNADVAMSRAKEQGKNMYQFYSADINTQAYQRLELWHSLRRAVERNELRVFYQPAVDLTTGRIVGVEALLRWQHPELGLVSPTQFIPLAEETGLIGPIGRWVLLETCKQAQTWHLMGLPPLRLGVNISPRQLNQLDLVSLIGQTLEETNFDPRYLEIELTESLLLHDKDKSAKTLRALKALGISIAIDDFGTGYSSLSYLQQFPISTLKIDQSFIRDLPSSQDAKALVRAIIGMAKALKLKVVAEGVENDEQRVFLREEGCDEFQGFWFSRPLPVDEMTNLLSRSSSTDHPSSAPAPETTTSARPTILP